MKGLTVQEVLASQAKDLKFKLVSGKSGLNNKVLSSNINRTGLALSGFFSYFPTHRVQIFGKTEFSYLNKMKKDAKEKCLKQLFLHKFPCIIVTSGLKPLNEMIELSNEKSIPLLCSSVETQELMQKFAFYLESELAPSMTLHGDLVEVYGVGVLILGDSGVGKSETALEMIERGHRLIADDVIRIKREPGRTLSGSSNEILKHYMEIRGLGIIDIKNLFGTRSVRDKKRAELIVYLEEWKKNKPYDRLGLKEQRCSILGVPVSKLIVPVRPGRNLAIIIEVAALNHRLKKIGINSARELENEIHVRNKACMAGKGGI